MFPVARSLTVTLTSTWSGAVGTGRRVDRDRFEVPETIEPFLGQAHALGIEPAGLELAQLAPDHLVLGAHVAADIDAPDVHAAARIDKDGECHFARLAIGVGHRIGGRKGVAERAHAVGDGLADRIDLFGVEHLAGLDGDQRREFLVEPEQSRPRA